MEAHFWQALSGIGQLVLTLIGVLALRWMNRIDAEQRTINDQLQQLAVHPQTCIRNFADKAENTTSHERLWKKNDEQDKTLSDHETRLKILEETR